MTRRQRATGWLQVENAKSLRGPKRAFSERKRRWKTAAEGQSGIPDRCLSFALPVPRGPSVHAPARVMTAWRCAAPLLRPCAPGPLTRDPGRRSGCSSPCCPRCPACAHLARRPCTPPAAASRRAARDARAQARVPRRARRVGLLDIQALPAPPLQLARNALPHPAHRAAEPKLSAARCTCSRPRTMSAAGALPRAPAPSAPAHAARAAAHSPVPARPAQPRTASRSSAPAQGRHARDPGLRASSERERPAQDERAQPDRLLGDQLSRPGRAPNSYVT